MSNRTDTIIWAAALVIVLAVVCFTVNSCNSRYHQSFLKCVETDRSPLECEAALRR